jgi:O-antigen ligase
VKVRAESIHRSALVLFAALLGLFEGPAEILCVVLLVTTALTGRLKDLRAHPVLIGAVLWAVAGSAGVLTADFKVSSSGYLRPLHALALIVGGFGLRNLPGEVLAKMAWAFGLAITLNCAYGLLQVAVGPLPLDELLQSTKNSSQIYVPGSRTQLCASGLFYNRIRLAHVGAMGVSMLSVIMFATGRRKLRILAGAGLTIVVLALLLTYARMVLVAGSTAGLVLVLLVSRPRNAGFLAAGGGTLAVLVILTEAGRARLARSGEDLEIRGRIFKMALRIFEQHPWFGAGHGNYTRHARPMLQPGWSRNWTVDAHNLYLHTLAETGIVGMLGFAVALALGASRMLRRVKSEAQNQTAQAVLHRVGFLILLTFLVLGLLHQPLHHAAVGIGFWTALGLGAMGPSERPEKVCSEPRKTAPARA